VESKGGVREAAVLPGRRVTPREETLRTDGSSTVTAIEYVTLLVASSDVDTTITLFSPLARVRGDDKTPDAIDTAVPVPTEYVITAWLAWD